MTMPGFDGEAPKDVLTVGNLGTNTQNLNPTKVKGTSQGRMSSGFLGSTGGLTSGLATTATNLFGGFIGDIVDDTSETTVESPQDVSDQVGGFFSNPISKLFDGILEFFSPILQGLTEGLTGAAGFLAGLFSIRWDQVDNHDVQIEDLQDSTQVLEGIIGYGQWYSNASITRSGTSKIPYNVPVGPAVGCINDGTGTVTLGSRGLWRAEMILQSGTAAAGNSAFGGNIIVRAPGGAVFSQRKLQVQPPDGAFGTITREGSVVVPLSFTVPTPGYTVEAEVYAQTSRLIWGGITYSGFTVDKVSDELGPGVRLSSAFTATGSYARLSPMAATGGGAVSSNGAVVGPGITAARVDARVIGSGAFNARLLRNSTVVHTSTGVSAHSLLYSGAVVPGDVFAIEVQGAGVIVSANNATWLTIMNNNQTSAST